MSITVFISETHRSGYGHKRNDLPNAFPSSGEVPSELPPFLSPYCVIMVGRGSNAMSHKTQDPGSSKFGIVLFRPSNIWLIKFAETPKVPVKNSQFLRDY
jgi:hypothetical protein